MNPRVGEDLELDGNKTEFEVGERAEGSGPPGDGAGGGSSSSRLEALLRQGDELFSAGRFDAALHVWTRVLFLHRGNPEARKGIERARQCLAERQRRLDATVAEARRLYDERGEEAEARRRLDTVLAVDPRHADARHLEDELSAAERRARARDGGPSLPGQAPPLRKRLLPRPSPARQRDPRVDSPAPRWKMSAFVGLVCLAFALGAVVLYENWESIVSGGAFAHPVSPGSGPIAEPGPDEVPGISELHYYNGARLFAKGRYREALAELGRVERSSRFGVEARSLILRIEERLLRGVQTPRPGEVQR